MLLPPDKTAIAPFSPLLDNTRDVLFAIETDAVIIHLLSRGKTRLFKKTKTTCLTADEPASSLYMKWSEDHSFILIRIPILTGSNYKLGIVVEGQVTLYCGETMTCDEMLILNAGSLRIILLQLFLQMLSRGHLLFSVFFHNYNFFSSNSYWHKQFRWNWKQSQIRSCHHQIDVELFSSFGIDLWNVKIDCGVFRYFKGGHGVRCYLSYS